MSGSNSGLIALNRQHRRAMAQWDGIRATLPGLADPSLGGVTICSVAFRARYCLERNHQLMALLNAGASLPEWLLYDNNVEPAEMMSNGDDRFTVVRPESRDVDMGYEHAIGIARLLSRVSTRFLLVLDPDCFIVRPDWVRDVTAHMTRQQLGFFGTPINPRRHNSYRYFPYMVCMFVDLSRVPLADLCFIPDVWSLGVSLTYRARRALAGIPKAGLLFRWLLTEQWLTNGWRIKAQYGDGRTVPFECVQPVWDVEHAVPPGVKQLVHRLTPGSVSPVPKQPGYCSPRGFASTGAPDLEALGWEEFMWHERPFAFHVGSVHGKPGRYEADLERVLSAFGARSGSAAASELMTAR
jgi:hypothetical protein